MIRILELLSTTALGGGPRQVYELARRLPREEFAVAVAGPRDGPFFERFRELGLAVTELRTDRLGPGPLAAALRAAREYGAHVIHSHGKGAGLYGRLAARRAGAAAVHTFHGIHYERYPPPLRRAYLGLERWLARRTDTIIHVSPTQAAEAVALGLSGLRRSVTVLNGVDLEEQDRVLASAAIPRQSLGLPPDAFVLGTVARFDPIKRLDALIGALGALGRPRVWLLLVGGGGEAGRLRRLVAESRLDGRVVFGGWLEDPARVYPAIDLYVAAAAKEGMPLALLEAMGAGLAVVATDVAGHRDVVRNGETGLLVPAGDVGALGAAIGTLIDEPDRRRRMGRSGRARVLEEFGIQPMVDRTAEVYRAAAAAIVR